MRNGRTVVNIYPFLFEYRLAFHNLVKEFLADEAIEYGLIYSSNPKMTSPRGDLRELSWAVDVPCHKLRVGHRELRYQHALRRALAADLAIFQQENSLLVNYPLQLARLVGGPRTAFMGHGKNFQSSKHDNFAKWKNLLTSRVDWWFAYTQASARIVESTGFPSERITVFNNALDTSAIARELASITAAEQEALRSTLFAGSENIGIYVGALYPMKRIDFLLAAAELIKKSVDDFHLLIVGAGEDAKLAAAASARHPWIHYVGPKFGREKTVLASLARVFLMPGAGGLAVLDSFAYGLPMVATDYPFHGPEMDYLEHGVNGLKEISADDPIAYASAVARLLQNATERERLRDGAKRALTIYTVEAMARRFAGGVIEALRAPPRGRIELLRASPQRP